MPVTAKSITIIASETVDKAWVVLRNLSTGDIWHGVIETDTCIMSLANDNIWGNEPQQWINGNKLDVVIIGSAKIGGAQYTLAEGVSEIEVTMATDTAISIFL